MATYGPCENWPVKWTCDVSCESPTVTGEAVTLATEILWGLSGRQFGLCEVTLRPCRKSCSQVPWSGSTGLEWAGESWLGPALISGAWFNVICDRCTGDCSCSTISEVSLPAPVHEVTQVKVDGDILATSAYRLDDSRRLVRTDGDDWPRCNDMALDDTEDGTWSVTADYGIPVPEGGEWAVGELACQLIRARLGEECRLSPQVTQLVRQGVTMEFPSISEMLKDGLTGLYLVDMFIATWNPNGLRRRSGVYSVDTPSHRRVGT